MVINNPAMGVEIKAPQIQVFNASAPATWADLDLSAVVGAKVALVILKILHGTSAQDIAVRQNGDTDEFFDNNQSESRGDQIAQSITGVHEVLIVLTDSAGIIEWKTSSTGGTTTVDVIAFIS